MKTVFLFVLLLLSVMMMSCEQDHTTQPGLDMNTVTDIDGNMYETMRVGDKLWMTENLRATRYRNGDPIPVITEGSEWQDLQSGAMSAYSNYEDAAQVYGRLYNWYAVADERGLAPVGWHVATDEEWQMLIDHFGGKDLAGGLLKEAGTSRWQSPNAGPDERSGFCALPGGKRDPQEGAFYGLHAFAHFWTSTENPEYDYAFQRWLGFDRTRVKHTSYLKSAGYSVRCVKD